MLSILRSKLNLKDLVKFSSTFTEKMSDLIAEKQEQIIRDKTSKKGKFYKPRHQTSKKRRWEYSRPNANATGTDNSTIEATQNSEHVDNGQGVVETNNTSSSGSSSTKKTPVERVKLRKHCILMGYSGVGYFGMQRNPGMKTIEEELLIAMLKNKWLNQEAFDQCQIIGFQRAARTDKGVSAARQCVSARLPESINFEDLNKDLPPQIRVYAVKRVTKGFNAKENCNSRTYTYTLPTMAFADQNANLPIASINEYRLPEEKLVKIREVLKGYEGTRNFHNFTSRRDAFDPSANRYILSFGCDEPFLVSENIEYVTLKVQGQSFVLHQIRKMVGLAIAIVRGLTCLTTMDTAFSKQCIDIPKAPGLGLVLDFLHYERYNTRYSGDGFHSAIDWTLEEIEIEKFCKDFIYSNIFETEQKENTVMNWLDTLTLHSYDLRLLNADLGNSDEDKNRAVED